MNMHRWFQLVSDSIQANPGWTFRAKKAQEAEGSDTGLRADWVPPITRLTRLDRFTVQALASTLETVKTVTGTPLEGVKNQYLEGVITDIEFVIKATDMWVSALDGVHNSITGLEG